MFSFDSALSALNFCAFALSALFFLLLPIGGHSWCTLVSWISDEIRYKYRTAESGVSPTAYVVSGIKKVISLFWYKVVLPVVYAVVVSIVAYYAGKIYYLYIWNSSMAVPVGIPFGIGVYKFIERIVRRVAGSGSDKVWSSGDGWVEPEMEEEGTTEKPIDFVCTNCTERFRETRSDVKRTEKDKPVCDSCWDNHFQYTCKFCGKTCGLGNATYDGIEAVCVDKVCQEKKKNG